MDALRFLYCSLHGLLLHFIDFGCEVPLAVSLDRKGNMLLHITDKGQDILSRYWQEAPRYCTITAAACLLLVELGVREASNIT